MVNNLLMNMLAPLNDMKHWLKVDGRGGWAGGRAAGEKTRPLLEECLPQEYTEV